MLNQVERVRSAVIALLVLVAMVAVAALIAHLIGWRPLR